MFNWLFNRHKHNFNNWIVIKRFSNSYGEYVIIQQRECTTCGFTQVKQQSV